MAAESSAAAVLRLPGGSRKERIFSSLDASSGEASSSLAGVDASLLGCELDRELADRLLEFCARLPGAGASLRLAHSDLGSGTDLEQRIFDRLAEQEATERSKKFYEQAKRDSSKEKDFASAAGKRRKAEEGINVTSARLADLETELAELERRKKETAWYALFSQMESRSCGTIDSLDLSDCGLHATGMVALTRSLLELEHRGDGRRLSELILDGNDLGDIGMTALTAYMRLSSHLQCLRIRNVGITDRGVSQILSGLVGNKTLRLVDLRCNGLASMDISKAALSGVQRFNKGVEVLLE